MNFRKASIFQRDTEKPEGQSRQRKDGNGGEDRKNALRQKEKCHPFAL